MNNDILKHTQLILDNKIEINKQEPKKKYFLVYFLHNDDIVYIGRTLDVKVYVEERKVKYSATHYYFEEVAASEIDNYLAFLILEIQPIYNSQINKNSKYISCNTAKLDYFIDKTSFKKVYKEYGGYKFGSSLYIEKQIFDDVFAKVPYDKDMPKVKTRILLVEDYIQYQLDSTCGVVQDILYDKESNPVLAYRDYKTDYKKESENINILENKEYQVINLINSNTFEAMNHEGKKITLCANDYIPLGHYHKFNKNVVYTNKWISAINEDTKYHIRMEYQKELENK